MGTCTSQHDIKNKSKQNKKTQFKEKVKHSKTMDQTSVKSITDECFDRFDRNQDGFLDFYQVVQLVKYSYSHQGKTSQKNPLEEYRNAARRLMNSLRLQDESRINRKQFYNFYKNM